MSSNGEECLIPSLFVDNDYKRHMSINLNTGLWQDFKSGETGGFTKLFSILENISYKEAESRILFKTFFLDDNSPEIIQEIKQRITKNDDLLDCELIALNIHSHGSKDLLVQAAWTFLFGRKLFTFDPVRADEYFVCKMGKYRNRIVIPFRKNENLFYFQARSLKAENKPKYLNPGAEEGIRPSHILYPYDEEAQDVVICEGPFDAISLQLQGVNATCTMGCHASHVQMDILKEFPGDIILGYDNDEAGQKGLKQFETLRKRKGMKEFYVVNPPKKYKDWNDAHAQGEDLKTYIQEAKRLYDYEYKMDLLVSSL